MLLRIRLANRSKENIKWNDMKIILSISFLYSQNLNLTFQYLQHLAIQYLCVVLIWWYLIFLEYRINAFVTPYTLVNDNWKDLYARVFYANPVSLIFIFFCLKRKNRSLSLKSIAAISMIGQNESRPWTWSSLLLASIGTFSCTLLTQWAAVSTYCEEINVPPQLYLIASELSSSLSSFSYPRATMYGNSPRSVCVPPNMLNCTSAVSLLALPLVPIVSIVPISFSYWRHAKNPSAKTRVKNHLLHSNEHNRSTG